MRGYKKLLEERRDWFKKFKNKECIYGWMDVATTIIVTATIAIVSSLLTVRSIKASTDKGIEDARTRGVECIEKDLRAIGENIEKDGNVTRKNIETMGKTIAKTIEKDGIEIRKTIGSLADKEGKKA